MTNTPVVGFLCAGKNPLELSVSVNCFQKLCEIFKAEGFVTGSYYTIITYQGGKEKTDSAINILKHICSVCDVVITVGCEGFSKGDIMPDVTDVLCNAKSAYFANIFCGSVGVNVALEKENVSDERMRIYPESDFSDTSVTAFVLKSERRDFADRITSALERFIKKLKSGNSISLDERKLIEKTVKEIFEKNSQSLLFLPPSRASAGIYFDTLVLNVSNYADRICPVIKHLCSRINFTVYNLCGKNVALNKSLNERVKTSPEFQKVVNKKDIVNT